MFRSAGAPRPTQPAQTPMVLCSGARSLRYRGPRINNSNCDVGMHSPLTYHNVFNDHIRKRPYFVFQFLRGHFERASHEHDLLLHMITCHQQHLQREKTGWGAMCNTQWGSHGKALQLQHRTWHVEEGLCQSL